MSSVSCSQLHEEVLGIEVIVLTLFFLVGNMQEHNGITDVW